MTENMDVSYDEFFGAFDGEDGNQTDPVEETGEIAETENPEEEPTGEPDGGETAEEVTEEAEKDGAEGEPEADDKGGQQKFTIKVNKESREVGLEEMTELAQKGADYDRVKGQLEASRQNEQTLQAKLTEQQEVMDLLQMVSEGEGRTVAELAERMYLVYQTAAGKTENEAKQELQNARLKKENDALKAQQAKQVQEDPAGNRAKTELAEFRKAFPDVELTKELCDKLRPGIESGLTMTSAYLRMENERLAADIQALKQKEAVEAQNRKNRAAAPGSQRDSGGQRTKDAFDDFFAAFDK